MNADMNADRNSPSSPLAQQVRQLLAGQRCLADEAQALAQRAAGVADLNPLAWVD